MNTQGFVADVHLGKLARALRLLGFDTRYSNTFTPAQLVAMAKEENAVLLSRSTAFSKITAIQSFLIQSEEPEKQLQAVVQHFNLQKQLQPFTRCLICNGQLEAVTKESVYTQLEPNTATFFDAFWQCATCKRIYWKGSHYDRMLKLVEKVTQSG
jgi:uncharacterized protein